MVYGEKLSISEQLLDALQKHFNCIDISSQPSTKVIFEGKPSESSSCLGRLTSAGGFPAEGHGRHALCGFVGCLLALR